MKKYKLNVLQIAQFIVHNVIYINNLPEVIDCHCSMVIFDIFFFLGDNEFFHFDVIWVYKFPFIGLFYEVIAVNFIKNEQLCTWEKKGERSFNINLPKISFKYNIVIVTS